MGRGVDGIYFPIISCRSLARSKPPPDLSLSAMTFWIFPMPSLNASRSISSSLVLSAMVALELPRSRTSGPRVYPCSYCSLPPFESGQVSIPGANNHRRGDDDEQGEAGARRQVGQSDYHDMASIAVASCSVLSRNARLSLEREVGNQKRQSTLSLK